MNKKIKSVKLAKDYRTAHTEVTKGQTLAESNYYPNSWVIKDTKGYDKFFHRSDIENNNTGLFEVEYEDEHFEFTGLPVSDYDSFFKNHLNALADWCEEKYPAFKVDIIIGYKNYEGMLAMTEAFRHYCFGTIKLNNYESASLFISELNRKENEAVREYYIELLKSGRLK